jgi:hypothetical protein
MRWPVAGSVSAILRQTTPKVILASANPSLANPFVWLRLARLVEATVIYQKSEIGSHGRREYFTYNIFLIHTRSRTRWPGGFRFRTWNERLICIRGSALWDSIGLLIIFLQPRSLTRGAGSTIFWTIVSNDEECTRSHERFWGVGGTRRE